ncbi:MAG TPA: succinate dehydrogenase cytochrome b subunit [Vicinamibacteria bacterium]|nr:succinate dehydrogenase cytochrome b subunit [Vicinamibacteria bacterium]
MGFFASSIGKKVVMAVTGLALFGFVVAHMLGNLQVYLGREALNAYAEALRRVPAVLWAMRFGLLAAAALHVWSAYSLTRINRAARPVGYRERASRASTYASRTMRWSGVILLLFVVYHLLHFTIGTRSVHPRFVPGDVYHNFVTGFQHPLVSAFYALAMLALGLHMYHGVSSMVQTVGLSHPRYDRWRQAFAVAITAVVVAGNLSFPVAVMTGLLREAPSPAVPSRAEAAR